MCVIAAKPIGKKMPNTDTIRAMWARNPDGAGIMYARKGTVHIDKGFMKLDEFLAHLDKLNRTIDLTKVAVVMHFRITTHGGTCPANCHPFPISEDIPTLQALHTTDTLAVAHNGIIPNKPRPGISDTMEFIASVLSPLREIDPHFTENKTALKLIENAIHSKMAFLDSKGNITTVGSFTDRDGILYSNTNHETIRTYTYTPTSAFVPTSAAVSTKQSSPRAKQKKAKKHKTKRALLMMADLLPYGSFVRYSPSNEFSSDLTNLLIDEDGRTYSYAPEDDLCYPEPNIHIYRYTGSNARFEYSEANLEKVAYTYADMAARKAR